MALQYIDLSQPNDGLGDLLRDGGEKINNNFAFLKALIDSGATQVELDNAVFALQQSINNLQSQINGKANIIHTHTTSQIIGLQQALDSKVDKTLYNWQVNQFNIQIAQINQLITEIMTLTDGFEERLDNIDIILNDFEGRFEDINEQIDDIQNQLEFITDTINNLQIQIDNLQDFIDNLEHNGLSGLQGGRTDEYFHLDQSQHGRVLDLIYINGTSVLSNAPTTGERGLSTNINLTYNITSGDDIILEATISNGVGSVLSNVNGGTQTVSGGSFVNNNIFTLTTTFTRKGVTQSDVDSSNYITYVPQWSGLSNNANLNSVTYSVLNSILTKVVQNGTVQNRNYAPNNQYVWFVSTNSNAQITNNGFNTIIGNWDDPTAFFIKQTVTFTLADGTTNANLTFYRSRLLLTHSTQNYTLT